jgi:ABC-type nitrate/sulfonate/bicarbonate transport system substrate-binding protein
MSSPTLVRFGSFSPSLPHLIAMREGYYKERGLHVEQHRIPSSPAMREALRANDLDVVLTSPDNIANYRLNGSARAHLDARIMAGVDGAGSVSLMGRPGLRDLDDIRGGRVTVDARGSGFAFLLYELLQQRGLSPGTHYSVVEMGGTPGRFDGLIRGTFDATILNAGFDVRAETYECPRLARTADTIPGYLATVLAAPGKWIDAAPATVSRFLSEFSRATSHLLDPVHHEQCIELIVDSWQVPGPVAARILADATDSQAGLVAAGAVGRAQLEATLNLRRRWGGFDHHVDLSAEVQRPRGLVDRRFVPER